MGICKDNSQVGGSYVVCSTQVEHLIYKYVLLYTCIDIYCLATMEARNFYISYDVVRYECSRMILIYGGVQSHAYLFIYHMLHLPRLHARGNYNICIVCALSVNQ